MPMRQNTFGVGLLKSAAVGQSYRTLGHRTEPPKTAERLIRSLLVRLLGYRETVILECLFRIAVHWLETLFRSVQQKVVGLLSCIATR